MLPGLSEIKLRRKQLGLTQSDLALEAAVSQSLITKIESGKLVPSYDKAKKLFDILESMHSETKAKARDLMTKRVIATNPKASVKHAAYMMKKHSISQLPIIENGVSIGTISEKGLVEKLQSKHDAKDLAKLSVREVMEETLPTIQEKTPFNVVSAMLEHYPALLVSRKGKIAGIIAKSDLLSTVLMK